MNVIIKNKSGSALITVIIVFAMLIILGMSLLSVSSADAMNSVRQDNKTQAHYLGRSGVNAGLKMLNNKITSISYDDLDTLVAALNSDAVALMASDSDSDPNTYKVDNAGSFNLRFERYNSLGIKIISEGIIKSNPEIREMVTLIVKTKLPIEMHNNPGTWMQSQSS